MTYVYVMCDHSAAPPVAPEYKRLCAGEDGDDLLALYQLSLVELREKYIFKGGEVWTLPASGRRILIREHDERLFALMCHDMNLGRVGSKLPSARSKALLAGTPGMGKSTFMWVAAITFMKMVKADPSVEHVQHVDLLQRNGRTKLKVAVFNPHVSGLRIRWTKLAGAEMVYLGQEPNSMSCVRTVRLFDAGANWTQLPCTEALVYAFATSPADPRYYDRWMMKDAIQPRYVMPWTWGEIKALARVVGKPELECFQQFELIGGNPRGVFDYSMAELTATVKRRTTSLAACDFDKLDQMLRVNDSHSGSHTPTFSLVQLWPRHWADTSNGFGDYREYSVRATRAAWHVSITPHDCAGVCQVRFASPSIYQRYVSTNYAAKTAQIAKAIHMGLHSNLPGVGDQFEDFAHSVVPRQGFAERDILFMERCTQDAAPVWRFEQAKLGLLVHADHDGQVSCPRNLTEYNELITDLSEAVDVRTATPTSFRRAVAPESTLAQRTELLMIFQANTTRTLGDALRAVKARPDGSHLLKLLKAKPTKWRFGNEFLHLAFKPPQPQPPTYGPPIDCPYMRYDVGSVMDINAPIIRGPAARGSIGARVRQYRT